MTIRVAVPSRGRLRDSVLSLLDHAGFSTTVFHGAGSRATINGVELIEMRPRDAGAWLAAGRIAGAFLSTDIVLEEGLDHLETLPLGVARSDLLWAHLTKLRELDATGIVALPPDALLPE